jgi:hypothetical protein
LTVAELLRAKVSHGQPEWGPAPAVRRTGVLTDLDPRSAAGGVTEPVARPAAAWSGRPVGAWGACTATALARRMARDVPGATPTRLVQVDAQRPAVGTGVRGVVRA